MDRLMAATESRRGNLLNTNDRIRDIPLPIYKSIIQKSRCCSGCCGTQTRRDGYDVKRNPPCRPLEVRGIVIMQAMAFNAEVQ